MGKKKIKYLATKPPKLLLYFHLHLPPSIQFDFNMKLSANTKYYFLPTSDLSVPFLEGEYAPRCVRQAPKQKFNWSEVLTAQGLSKVVSFCNGSLIRSKPRPLFYVLSMTAFKPQQRGAAAEPFGLQRPNYLLTLYRKVAHA